MVIGALDSELRALRLLSISTHRAGNVSRLSERSTYATASAGVLPPPCSITWCSAASTSLAMREASPQT